MPRRRSYRKVQEEVDSVLQGRTPAAADLARLPYCLQVFKEALRLYPPAYAISRRALRDIEIDGYLIPKGTIMRARLWEGHKDPKTFPDPYAFRPDRFIGQTYTIDQIKAIVG